MRVQVNDAVAVGPTQRLRPTARSRSSATTAPNAGVRTHARRHHRSAPDDFNPERIILDDLIAGGPTLPRVNVGDTLPRRDRRRASTTASATSSCRSPRCRPLVAGGLAREVDRAAAAPASWRSRRSTSRTSTRPTARRSSTRWPALIVNNLRVARHRRARGDPGQQRRRPTTATVDADARPATADRRDRGRRRPDLPVPPDRPGRTTRTAASRAATSASGFLFRTDRGPDLRRPPGRRRRPRATTVVDDAGHARAVVQPGPDRPDQRGVQQQPQAAGRRVHVQRPDAVRDRQPLQLQGRRPAAVRPLPAAGAQSPRPSAHQQAQIVNDFVDAILAVDPNANVVVLGDLNDFEFSTTLHDRCTATACSTT